MKFGAQSSLVGGILAAIGASACCVGPLVLVLLGIGGTWVARLTALEPYRPYFSFLTLLFISGAYYKLYVQARACMPDDACADDRVLTNQRRLFWIVTIPVLVLLAFPWFAPLFY